MFTGVGKLKISLAECGFEWERKSALLCVCVLLSALGWGRPRLFSHKHFLHSVQHLHSPVNLSHAPHTVCMRQTYALSVNT